MFWVSDLPKNTHYRCLWPLCRLFCGSLEDLAVHYMFICNSYDGACARMTLIKVRLRCNSMQFKARSLLSSLNPAGGTIDTNISWISQISMRAFDLFCFDIAGSVALNRNEDHKILSIRVLEVSESLFLVGGKKKKRKTKVSPNNICKKRKNNRRHFLSSTIVYVI